MNRIEAQSVLDIQLATFSRRSYLELAGLVDKPSSTTVKAASGEEYQIEFNIFYDSAARTDLRIFGSIDNGGWRAFLPVTRTLIMKPNGETL